MSLQFYKFLHLVGVLLVFLSLGGILQHVRSGGTKSDNPSRRCHAVAHGLGLFLILLGGFGMLAKLKLFWPLPIWVVLKAVIWLFLGACLALIYRKPADNKALWWAVLIAGIAAAYLGLMKP